MFQMLIGHHYTSKVLSSRTPHVNCRDHLDLMLVHIARNCNMLQRSSQLNDGTLRRGEIQHISYLVHNISFQTRKPLKTDLANINIQGKVF